MLAVMRLTYAEPQLRSVNAALVGGAGLAAASALSATVTGVGCLVYSTTGQYCAFCGGTRCVIALGRGDFVTALQDNALTVILLSFVCLRLCLMLAGARRIVEVGDGVIVRVNLRVWEILLVAWMIARNLPWFSYLGPPR